MKRLIIFLTIVLTVLSFKDSISQVRVKGFLQSSGYAWENYNQSKRVDYYQGLKLWVAPQNHQNLYFNTYLREAYRGDPAEWQEKIYNLYLNWDFADHYRVRFGRQFLYNGVINGTVDGALLSAYVTPRLGVKLVAGTEAPFNRELEVKNWKDGNVLGGYLSYNIAGQQRAEVSYIQKSRDEDKYWQQIGGAVNGFILPKLTYYARFDYNLLSSAYQMMRGRLMYLESKWTLSAEYNSEKPRVYEDSFFSIFEIEAYNQLRAAGTYRIGMFDLGLQYLYTKYEEDDNNRLIGTATTRYGTIGIIYQKGFGGKDIGYFGEVYYEFLPHLTGRLFNSYYNYDRGVTDISEEALSFSGGLNYRLNNILDFMAEVQQTNNTYFDNDWRGLFRVTYLFNFK
ncbi:MAG: hypothetical protein P8184_14770 [Calditrichia bacterium]